MLLIIHKNIYFWYEKTTSIVVNIHFGGVEGVETLSKDGSSITSTV